MEKEERERLLQAAGLLPTVKGTRGKESGLALKADLHLPWYKLRKLRRWLSSFGVVLQSEPAMRQQISKELPFSLVAEMLPQSSKTGSVELKPVVKLPDLKRLVLYYLDQHEVAGSLTWHDGALPGNEVWVKVGGDHGGGSFKLSFQVANVQNLNAKQNTIPLLVFPAPDTAVNLATTLTLMPTKCSA